MKEKEVRKDVKERDDDLDKIITFKEIIKRYANELGVSVIVIDRLIKIAEEDVYTSIDDYIDNLTAANTIIGKEFGLSTKEKVTTVLNRSRLELLFEHEKEVVLPTNNPAIKFADYSEGENIQNILNTTLGITVNGDMYFDNSEVMQYEKMLEDALLKAGVNEEFVHELIDLANASMPIDLAWSLYQYKYFCLSYLPVLAKTYGLSSEEISTIEILIQSINVYKPINFEKHDFYNEHLSKSTDASKCKETDLGDFSYDVASKMMSDLMKKSGKFVDGLNPYIGRLKASYGYGKIIGSESLDRTVRTRLDYDLEKGVHFNFEDTKTGINYCIRVNDMTIDDYKNKIDFMNAKLLDYETTRRLSNIKVKDPNGKVANYNLYKKVIDDYLNNRPLTYLDQATRLKIENNQYLRKYKESRYTKMVVSEIYYSLISQGVYTDSAIFAHAFDEEMECVGIPSYYRDIVNSYLSTAEVLDNHKFIEFSDSLVGIGAPILGFTCESLESNGFKL